MPPAAAKLAVVANSAAQPITPTSPLRNLAMSRRRNLPGQVGYNHQLAHLQAPTSCLRHKLPTYFFSSCSPVIPSSPVDHLAKVGEFQDAHVDEVQPPQQAAQPEIAKLQEPTSIHKARAAFCLVEVRLYGRGSKKTGIPKFQNGASPGKWTHGEKPAVCPSCSILIATPMCQVASCQQPPCTSPALGAGPPCHS